jgi:hypothetical protein
VNVCPFTAHGGASAGTGALGNGGAESLTKMRAPVLTLVAPGAGRTGITTGVLGTFWAAGRLVGRATAGWGRNAATAGAVLGARLGRARRGPGRPPARASAAVVASNIAARTKRAFAGSTSEKLAELTSATA